jgi:hypothetical protein
MGILRVIAVAYERDIPLRILLDSFKVQTDNRWFVHVVHDGAPSEKVEDIARLYADDPQIRFWNTTKRYGCYGHPNRRMMLNKIDVNEDDFILLTNDDNYYVPQFVNFCQKYMTKKVGMIYFDMLHNYYFYKVLETKPVVNNIDMGAFIVRGSIAKEIGFKSNKVEADGIYCMDCVNYCNKNNFEVIKIPGILFVHN